MSNPTSTRPSADAPVRASVIVCTHNRSRSLVDACGAMAELAFDAPWEILIVDNRSTDDTLAVARAFADQHPERVRVVEEHEIGLSAARNAGVRHARGEILAFIDDDAFPAPDWLTAIDEAFREDDVLAAGGPVEPVFGGPLPPWLGPRYLPYVTVWDLGSEPLDLRYNEFPRGANIAFRREAFERFGPFSTHLGRKGKSLLSCEEIELCLRIERGGGRVRYAPKAHVKHMVSAARIDERWMLDRFGAQGRSEAIMEWQHGGWRALARGLRRGLRNARDARRHSSPEDKLFPRCQQRTFTAYAWRAWRCPLTVPRYRPREPAAPWLPFA